MARLNKKGSGQSRGTTHEGAPAKKITELEELRRSVLACLLWEDTFYENGEKIADRIADLVHVIATNDTKALAVSALAIEARSKYNLRHVPLLLCAELARAGRLRRKVLAEVIQRPDELTEFLAIYWRGGKCPLSAQVKKGLAMAFQKFDAYQLAKYDRPGAIRLRDVMFLTHPKPKDETQEAVWKALVDGSLESPDTWEVNLSKGKDKGETFTRLLEEKKLGYMALLRNLRNMVNAKVDVNIIYDALVNGAREGRSRRVLPFRFVSAAKHAPSLEQALNEAMVATLEKMPKLPGSTIVLIDVSGSMSWGNLSEKSELRPVEAAAALGVLVNGICEKTRCFTFDTSVREIPPRCDLSFIDAVVRRLGGGTNLGGAVQKMNTLDYDRLIVITDEQSHTVVPGPKGKGYMINVAPYQRGVGYGAWTHIDGWSESVVRYIQEIEGNADPIPVEEKSSDAAKQAE